MPFEVWQLDPAQTTIYYNTALCNALAKAGCHVHYWTSPFLYEPEPPFSGDVTANYAYCLFLDNRLLRRYRLLRRAVRAVSYPIGHWQVLRQAQLTPPDILHIQWSRWPALDIWLIQQMHNLHIPVVYTVHDVVPLFAQKSRRVYETIYKTADSLIVHTHANRAAFLQQFPQLPPERLHLIPLIEVEPSTTPNNASRLTARYMLNLPEDASVLLFFGTIRHYKGLSTLAAAFEIAGHKCPNLWLVVAGQPETRQESELLERLKAISNVIIHSAFVSSAEVWKYHFAADIAVFPYHQIYQSGALISAMGFGCPVIVSDVGGLPETVDGNGWIVPANNAQKLAEIILEAVSNRARLALMSQRSRDLVMHRHGAARVAKATLAVYQTLVQSRNWDA
jgi:glycosyltransferase involved in cell wall biosynthesis